jgi:hypothetical protein
MICANSLSAHLLRQLSRALWLTHLLTRCVMRGAQATSTQWRWWAGSWLPGRKQLLRMVSVVHVHNDFVHVAGPVGG